MALKTYFPAHLKRAGSTASDLSLGAAVGIAIGAALLVSLALLAIFYFRCYRQKRRRTRKGPSMRSLEGMKGSARAGSESGHSPRNRFGSILSGIFSSKRRSQAGQLQKLAKDDSSQHGPVRAKELDELPSPTAELEGDLVDRPGFGPEQARVLNPFDDASRQMNYYGPVPPYSSSTSATPPAIDAPEASRIRSLEMNHLVLSTDAPPAAWHVQRTGPPPALTIEPPMHSRSPSDAYSTYAGTSTYGANTQSPYGYYAFNIPDNVPEVPPLPSNSHQHDLLDDCNYESTHSLHSSNSNKQLLRQSSSPHSPDSAPSMTPTTPTTYPPEKQSLSKTHFSPSSSQRPTNDKFEYLGPLPDNISMPTPRQFRTDYNLPPQEAKYSAPRILVPDHTSPERPHYRDSDNTSPTSSAAIHPAYLQDPLLHDANPFKPHQSPVNSTFTRELSQHGGSSRRSSTDSLGSNFTVEEEARIQAQVVKNLAMLGKERVVGENDIVHIPQISNKRYSWEG